MGHYELQDAQNQIDWRVLERFLPRDNCIFAAWGGMFAWIRALNTQDYIRMSRNCHPRDGR
ncbi:hypothetical protein [Pseudomonas sp. 31 R 17]|uniref:hypothetical protein n=1 Tax=Pseudomonas sp. 31 R 17 TaxID=1844101 RepID=UPI0011468CDD|nr:hypothetical protein [Pseudomonas sp. 31 R 17]